MEGSNHVALTTVYFYGNHFRETGPQHVLQVYDNVTELKLSRSGSGQHPDGRPSVKASSDKLG